MIDGRCPKGAKSHKETRRSQKKMKTTAMTRGVTEETPKKRKGRIQIDGKV